MDIRSVSVYNFLAVGVAFSRAPEMLLRDLEALVESPGLKPSHNPARPSNEAKIIVSLIESYCSAQVV
ncbi:hypothetical protein PHLCEN_2v11555 [Hermanssonia centrifuga]|uniref:Uncharacterized protein n=1 Tax=Hermanssonia centrifuga TaxID=98765 RepID=A0A2R6NKN0_9APHY|nr:hypothetical protein PHLCEN_2v11555 [Hermanssonia centrifuga]